MGACVQPKYDSADPNYVANTTVPPVCTDTVTTGCCDADIDFATTVSSAYTSFGVMAFCLLFIACMYSRIKLAIGCISEAARCIKDQPSMNLFPGFQFVLNLIFLIFWISGCMFIAASGDIEPKTISIPTGASSVSLTGVAKKVTLSNQLWLMSWFWLFGYFWVTQFIAALGEMVLAGAAASWYFRTEEMQKEPIKKPLLKSFKRALKYHLGSIAFGSLIIAIIKFIRAVVAYVQAKCNKAAGKAGAIGKLVKVVLCAIQCCIWCMEKCMKFINRNAYILIAIHGISFCTAAKRAFFLILRNIARIGAVALLSTIFLFLGKMFICAVPTTAGAFLLVMNKDTKVEAPAVPLALIAIASYIVGSSMMAVYGMTIDTMLVCFVGDEEANKDKFGGPYYATGALKSFVSAKAKECKEKGVQSGYDNDDEPQE